MAKTVLMCAPEHFDIEYEINPWMQLTNRIDVSLANRQWWRLRRTYREIGWQVTSIPPVDHLPDMVFTANGGLVIGNRVATATFRQPERQPEAEFFESWFRTKGYEIFRPEHDFEGEGDAMLWRDTIFAGYPWRTDKASHPEVAEFFAKRVVSLQLTDARFYHLDTAFTVIDEGTVALYPKAFTEESLAAVRKLVPNVIEAEAEDALAYGLNAISDGRHIVINDRAKGLIAVYRDRGFDVHATPVSEFLKSGGGVKCLSLDLAAETTFRLPAINNQVSGRHEQAF